MTTSKSTEKKAFLLLLLTLLALGFYVLYPFINVLLLSCVLVIMVYPLHMRLLKWTKGRQNISAIGSVLATLLLIVIPIVSIVGLVSAQVVSVVGHLASNISQPDITDLLSHWQQQLTFVLAKWEYQFNLNLDLVPMIQKGLSRLGSLVATYSPMIFAETANFMLNSFIMVIVIFFLFRDGDKFFAALIRISPVKDSYERRLAKEITGTIYGVFYGSFLTGIVQAVLAAIGFYFAGVEGPLVWGVITFFVSFIPIIGTAGVILPLILVQLGTGHTGGGIFLAIYGVVVIGLADNVLKPILIKSNLHQLVLFLSIFGGMAVFGAMGLLLGPVIMALLTATLKIYETDFTFTSRS